MDKGRTILSQSETIKVIEIWKHFIGELRGARRNVGVMQKMSQELKLHHNIELNPTELRTRINNLTKKFRSEKKKMGSSGGSPSDWPYFMEINSFIGHFKSNRIEEIFIETIDENTLGDDGFNQPSQDQEDIEQFSPGLNSTVTVLSSSSSSMPSTSPDTLELPRRDTRKKRTSSESDKLLELAKEESLAFKKFCHDCVENDTKKIQLLEENNAIQRELLKAILERSE